MWYLTVSATVFCYCLGLFVADKSTPKNDVASWLILLIAALFWPIVLPGSFIELVTKSSANKQNSLVNKPTKVSYQNN